ncbi:hypothetical protein BDV38DRAFT_271976 [Aspergillus pseudotamarii]|uniref:SHSP domain-containing protein n=1 Tax=Aspergillus pseudotamarii TaxID=132259 RepID=A0A5N6SRZ1_ASPPS|nr:uncharacterized protein BDV38DRAFT_271976 [Aspergillus pseudotamarii]KAE8136637.1 hypothetical protein BDV38DRAFT_271976 [Aspergillus pseudotamarii]
MAPQLFRSPVTTLIIALILRIEGVSAENFTFPTDFGSRFIVGDQVNVTWDVVTPRISLYEACGTEQWIISQNVVNHYSYVWIANRDVYKESGCCFVLESLNSQGKPAGQDNVTSVVFGVAKRYHDDPSPTSYHFASTSATSLTGTLTPTTTSSTESAGVVTATDVSAASPSTEHSRGGLSSAAKIGIGLGIPLGFLLVALSVGLFHFIRRRKRLQDNSPEASEPVWHPDGTTPLPGGFVDGSNTTKNVRGSHTDTIISELSSENYRTRDERQTNEVNELMDQSKHTIIQHKLNMKYSCHFHQPPQTWEMGVSMLEGHPFFAHHHPPRYEDLFEKRHGKCFKGKMHKLGKGMRDMGDNEFPEMPRFGFGGRGGRGGRHHPHHAHHHPYAFGHHGHEKFHTHPHKRGHGYGSDHELEPEHGFNPWTKHDRSGPRHPSQPGFHHQHHPHHKRGGPGPHFHSRRMFHHQGYRGSGQGRGLGKRNGKGKGFHPFDKFHHMHPLIRAHHHSRDTASFMPPVDVFATATQTIIHASLPGAQKSDLSVGYDAPRSMLRIAGVVHRPGVDEGLYRALLVGERARHLGAFDREVPVSHHVAVEGIQSRLEDGVLKVVLPRVEGEEVEHGSDVEEEMANVEKELSTPDGSDTEGEEEDECEVEDEKAEKEFVKVDIQ